MMMTWRFTWRLTWLLGQTLVIWTFLCALQATGEWIVPFLASKDILALLARYNGRRRSAGGKQLLFTLPVAA